MASVRFWFFGPYSGNLTGLMDYTVSFLSWNLIKNRRAAQWFHLAPGSLRFVRSWWGNYLYLNPSPSLPLGNGWYSTVYAIPKEVLTKNINWTDELSDWTRLSKWINHLLKSDCESGSCLFKNMVYCTVHPKINWLIIMFATVYCKLPHFLGLCPLFPIFLIH